MVWGGCWSLCSGLNSCTPLKGLITQVSLEILATETPGGRGAGNRTQCNVHRVSAALLRKSSSSGTFLLERIYFTSLSKMSLSIFSSVWGSLTFNQSCSLYTRRAYVTDMLLSSKIPRWQLSWISIWVHIAFINSFPYFLVCTVSFLIYAAQGSPFSPDRMYLCEERFIFFCLNTFSFTYTHRTLEYVKYIHV